MVNADGIRVVAPKALVIPYVDGTDWVSGQIFVSGQSCYFFDGDAAVLLSPA